MHKRRSEHFGRNAFQTFFPHPARASRPRCSAKYLKFGTEQHCRIDLIQGSHQSLQYYRKELQSRPYVYGTDHLPWDGGTPSLQTGRRIRDQMIAASRRVRVMP